MQQVDLVQFLKDGHLAGFDNSCSEAEIIRVFGQPEEVEDYGKKGKYLMITCESALLMDGFVVLPYSLSIQRLAFR